MGNLLHLHGDPHEQTLKALPWYLNATLDEAEAAMVEAHLLECPDCARELEAERSLRSGIVSDVLDVDQAWAAMRRTIGAITRPQDPAPRTPAWRRAKGRTTAIGWAVAGAMAASIATVAVLTTQPARPDASYHALGSAAAPARANGIVLFDPAMSEHDMRSALTASHAQITAGPLESGGFMLHLSPRDRARNLARLRSWPGVIMAEPIDPPEQP